ncbi:MAG TPA: macro domain-containing protein [Thermoanaerobaculia bacterium]|nr:macro domain-containing protein [Thermoanaerobaculia bacterium]
MNIQLLRADITSLKVDALVAPSDPHLQIPDGRAVVLTGGNLLARFVIQVPMPYGDDLDADAKLRASTTAALERADELAVASIGLPPVARSKGFSTERAARVMLGATFDYRSRARSLQRATFCLFGQEEYEVFSRVLEELER